MAQDTTHTNGNLEHWLDTSEVIERDETAAKLPHPETIDLSVYLTAQETLAEQASETDQTGETGKTDESIAPPVEPVFYRETIKETRHTSRRASFRRMAAIICLVCTLGTGSLGFGIGLAIPFSQRLLQKGINGSENGYDAQDTPPYGIESARYVYGDGDGSSQGSLADVVRLVEPAVVGVSSTFQAAENSVYSQQNTGDASGIIFADDAQKVYIVTNNHVISGASAVHVSIDGSSPLPAKLVGREANVDLAVISVEKKDMRNAGITAISIAVFGDSDAMEVGDPVLAIGNALGEGNSATFGIISAKERVIPIENRRLTVLQTSAAINPGNSGGPLVNTRGEVVGINTAKAESYDYYTIEGMGYSISSNVVKPIVEEIMSTSPRPFLGIKGDTITEAQADALNIPPIGVVVSDVIKGTSAEKAGIVRTDVITSFNGQAIMTMDQLIEAVKGCTVGDTVQVKILRGGETLTLDVKMATDTSDNF